MSDQAERICAGLARKLEDEWADWAYSCGKGESVELMARVLREAGLEDLLRAGQAMRELVGTPPYGSIHGHNWDAALARCEEKCKP